MIYNQPMLLIYEFAKSMQNCPARQRHLETPEERRAWLDGMVAMVKAKNKLKDYITQLEMELDEAREENARLRLSEIAQESMNEHKTKGRL